MTLTKRQIEEKYRGHTMRISLAPCGCCGNLTLKRGRKIIRRGTIGETEMKILPRTWKQGIDTILSSTITSLKE